jgi:RNA polymerase sigma-70 factor (ECF subfamily)
MMEFYPFDDDYVRRLRERDPATEEHFYAHFARRLLLICRSRLRAQDDARDACQEVFLRVLRAIRNAEGPDDGTKLAGYVHGFCNNVIREYQRGGRRFEPLAEDYEIVSKIDLEAELVSRETVRQVRDVLATMEPRDRAILTALFLEDQDKDEVCRRHDVTRDYLRVLVYRAKERFRRVKRIERDAH